MPARRIIPCLDVRDGVVVKGVKFRNHRVVGDIVELAERYRNEGADEIVLYDITASTEDRGVDVSWISRVARVLDIPFAVAGGIRSVEQAARRLECGADKISINSPALERPGLIDELAARFGSQCIVVGIDSRNDGADFVTHQYTGNPDKSRSTGRSMIEWVREVQDRGAGEIVLNCMNSDGVREGYDIEQLAAAREVCTLPLIASGGAGAKEHFADVFEKVDVSGALAASIFHSGEIPIPDLKRYLDQCKIEIRL
ncbi:MAG: imidazole glycerol phosphate synthase subunit HisF [Marinicaulis sp.]|nr:imidazole glycerol phosphate synthase subunit HisF [Marinicaulis sp.]